MHCPRERSLLEEYFEGVLNERSRSQVAAHLESCAACTAELVQLERLSSALASVPQTDPGPGLLHAIMARTAELPSVENRRAIAVGWRRLAVVAAGCALFLAAVSYSASLLLLKTAPLMQSSVAWMGSKAAGIGDCVIAGSQLAAALWTAIRLFADSLGIAGLAAAPALGMYAAAEVGLLVAAVLVLRWSRRRSPARLTLLV
jgi:hypothetical protein